jgi:DNA-binding transcriptional LysR family regulator
MLDLRNLETFLWVARLGGFRLAAEKLHTTQPAISARIAALETDLGVRLLDRGPRRIVLTVKGAELLGYTERMLALRAEMRGAIADPATWRGELRLGVPQTIVHTWLAALVERISRSNPALTVDIEVDSSSSLAASLQSGRIDIAFLHTPDVSSDLVSRPLCAFELGWFASQALPLENNGATLAAITRHPIMTFRRESAPYAALHQMLQREGHGDARIFSSASIAAIVRMARDGIGSCLLPAAAVREEVDSGVLCPVTYRHTLPRLAFHVGYRPKRDSHLAALVADLAVATAHAYQPDAGPDQKYLSQTSKRRIRPRQPNPAI